MPHIRFYEVFINETAFILGLKLLSMEFPNPKICLLEVRNWKFHGQKFKPITAIIALFKAFKYLEFVYIQKSCIITRFYKSIEYDTRK